MLVHSKARGFVWRGALCYGAAPYALPCPRQLPLRTFVQISPNLPLYKGRFPEVRIQSFTPAAVAGGFALWRGVPVAGGALRQARCVSFSSAAVPHGALPRVGCSPCGRCLAARSPCGHYARVRE